MKLDLISFIIMFGVLVGTYILLPSTLGYYVEYQRSCDQNWIVPQLNTVTPQDQSDYFDRRADLTCDNLLFLVLFTTGIHIFVVSIAFLVIIQFFIHNQIRIERRCYYD